MDIELPQDLRNLFKESFSTTKKCFLVGCNNGTIRAHSVQKAKILNKIAEDGNVLYYSHRFINHISLKLERTGKSKATTFNGFCKTHDKEIFSAIDDSDFIPGDQKQEFLYALLSCAKEYTTRVAMDHIYVKQMQEESVLEDEFYKGFNKGTKDLESFRAIFNKALHNKDYWRIKTLILTFDKEYPIAASSTFFLEQDQNSRIINGFSNIIELGHPLFFNLFPHNGKTYCLLSWFKKHEKLYSDFKNILNLNSEVQKVIVSNILCSYVENFVIKPSYWENIDEEVKQVFISEWGRSMKTSQSISLIGYKYLNLFI